MADTKLTSLEVANSGDLVNVNSAFLYLVSSDDDRQISLADLMTHFTKQHFAVAKLASVQTIDASTWEEVEWDTEETDTGGFYDATSPGVLVVPSDFSFAKITFMLAWENDSTGGRYARLWKNQTLASSEYVALLIQNALNETGQYGGSRILPVNSGDTFQLEVNPGSNNFQLQGGGFGGPSWIMIELYP